MALIPKINVCLKSNCTELLIQDTTGAYDPTTNPGGFGAPNIALGSVTSALLTITLPDSTSVTFDILSILNSPPTIVDGRFTIDTYDMGDFSSSGKFPDGIYEFEYLIDGLYSYHSKTYFFCQTMCCVDKMFAKVAENACGCNCDLDKLIKKALFAEAILLSASKSGFSCAQFDKTQKLIDMAKRYCDFNDCNCK